MRLLHIDRRPSGRFVYAITCRRTARGLIARHAAVDGSGESLHVLTIGARYALVVLWQRPAPDATPVGGADRSGARP